MHEGNGVCLISPFSLSSATAMRDSISGGTLPLVVEVGKTVAGAARSYRSSAMRLGMRGWCASDLGPTHFEETAHPVAGLAHGTVVLVEYLAVDEHLSDIGAKLIARLVPVSSISTRWEHVRFLCPIIGRSKLERRERERQRDRQLARS